ncbi:ankyrin repeat and SOCS box protein 13-like [Mizuhopecten yessoensis]|uniref:Ankyrin repeat and SOCS box protein 3 n=1 Tax=Mizuhopecten yessoensis TaxID=6573 RepID=A0A210Q7Y7_MIZYE|nr:ankyrin repeat and SOCS box protein 13-like [Mizuhopecten yessoensis]OWF44843.1 Ankyrin repeat and SOCS box protein 3 [Mizuhopecten yessoensis]
MKKAAKGSRTKTGDFIAEIEEAIASRDLGEITRLVKGNVGDTFLIACAFHQAVGKALEDVTRHFVSIGVSIDTPDPVFLETPLMHAIRNNRDELVKFLIKEGANVNYMIRSSGQTPLHVAVSSPKETDFSTQILKYLLTVHYIRLNEYNSDGRTPLMIAIKHGRNEAVDVLTSAGANVHLRMQQYGSTTAHLCFDMFNPCRNAESAKCLQSLMKCGLSPDVVHNGETPIFHAIRKNNVPALKVLIDANCDLDVSSTTWGVENNGQEAKKVTPIVLAYKFHKMRSVELLVEAGCRCYHLRWLTKSSDASNTLKEWFHDRISTPRSLKNLCRFCIRGAIGHLPHKKVELLDLPPALQDCILLKDVLS